MLIAEKLRFFSFSIFICAGALSSYAEEKKKDSNPAPGHSHSGESFNEGQDRALLRLMVPVMFTFRSQLNGHVDSRCLIKV